MGLQTKIAARNDYEQILMDLHGLEDDAEKFYHKKNAAAGTRLRKGMLNAKKALDAARKNVTVIKTRRKADLD